LLLAVVNNRKVVEIVEMLRELKVESKLQESSKESSKAINSKTKKKGKISTKKQHLF
jgi:hypothetical protein